MSPRVVCAFDWSRHCWPALRFADAIAARSRLPLTVLHIASPASESVHRERGERLQEGIRGVLGHADVPLTIEVGDPCEQLVAASRRAAVLVIGTRRRCAIRQKLGGSVSAVLTRRSSCPVIVVPPRVHHDAGTGSGATTVLCAARDERDIACAATASCWASDLELSLTVAYAVATPAMPAGVAIAAPPPVTPLTPAERKAAARESLERLLGEISALAPGSPQACVLLGSPGRRINELARSVRTGLVVVGPRRHGTGYEALFGSTTRHLLHRGSTPVMVCPRTTTALLADNGIPGDDVPGMTAVMRDRHGFWAERRRAGQEEAGLIAAEQIHALRQVSYSDLAARANGRTEVETVAALSGDHYRRRTSIRRLGSGDRERLRILVSVDPGTLRGRLNPLAEEMVLLSPDGEMVGDYTLASGGNDPRRYRFPGEQ